METSELTPIDRHLASLLNRIASRSSKELELASKLVSRFRGEGHVCVPLKELKPEDATKIEAVDFPARESWVKELRQSGVVGRPGEFAPLILDEADRLYLERYWQYEGSVTRNLKARLSESFQIQDDLEKRLADLFAEKKDMQKLAAFVAASSRLCVISGAPGTGKTRTIILICALLLWLEKNAEIALAAPTGKAAARLQEAIRQARDTLKLPAEIRLPAEAFTIQRLLGARGDSPHFVHNAARPLAADVVIIDEASMIDLALLAKLLDAVRPEARVMLVGDMDQLASVEAGSAFRDICTPGFEIGISETLATAFAKYTGENIPDAKPRLAPIHDVIVELRRNYRFPEGEGIARLSAAVSRGDAAAAEAVLENGGQVSWQPTPSVKNFERALRKHVLPRFAEFSELDDPQTALSCLNDFAVLCALRRGPFGAETVNAQLEQMLREWGKIGPRQRYFRGQPVMIVRNDYNTNLFNGDLGIVLPEAAGDLRVYFPGKENQPRSFAAARLPANETAFALTVHKSQGSEFKECLVILPDRDSPVLTRELLYTAVTRVRKRVEVWGSKPVLEQTISRRVQRSSGLRDALWSGGK